MTKLGRVIKYGDNVDTDAIIAARYLNDPNPLFWAQHCMEDLDPDFSKKISPGDIILGGENFGCGSSREHAPLAIKAAGISLVIATSFARIFYRNSLNVGLAILECPEVVAVSQEGDQLSYNLEEGIITNLTRNLSFRAEPFPEFMRALVEAGGLINYLQAGEF